MFIGIVVVVEALSCLDEDCGGNDEMRLGCWRWSARMLFKLANDCPACSALRVLVSQKSGPLITNPNLKPILKNTDEAIPIKHVPNGGSTYRKYNAIFMCMNFTVIRIVMPPLNAMWDTCKRSKTQLRHLCVLLPVLHLFAVFNRHRNGTTR